MTPTERPWFSLKIFENGPPARPRKNVAKEPEVEEPRGLGRKEKTSSSAPDKPEAV